MREFAAFITAFAVLGQLHHWRGEQALLSRPQDQIDKRPLLPALSFCGLRREGHVEILDVVHGEKAAKVCSIDARKDGAMVWFEASPNGEFLAVLAASEPKSKPIRIYSLKPPFGKVQETGHEGYLALGMKWVEDKLLSLFIKEQASEGDVRDYVLKEWSMSGARILGRATNALKLPFPDLKFPPNILPPSRRSEFYMTDLWYNRFGVLPIAKCRKSFVFHGDRIEILLWGEERSKVLLNLPRSDTSEFRLLRQAGPEQISVTIVEHRNPGFVGPPGGLTDAMLDQQTERYSTVIYDAARSQFTFIPGYVGVQVLPPPPSSRR